MVLLAHGADVNARDKFENTPLHWAAVYNGLEAAKALLTHGADVNARNQWGDTPLGRWEMVHRTLETPMNLGNSHREMELLLRHHGGQ